MSQKNSVSAVFPFFKLFCKFANKGSELRPIQTKIGKIIELSNIFSFKIALLLFEINMITFLQNSILNISDNKS